MSKHAGNPRLSDQPANATCDDCGRVMNPGTACIETTYLLDGTEHTRVPHSGESNCRDCHTPPGGLHHPGCDSERCPNCQGQIISCGCGEPDDELGSGSMPKHAGQPRLSDQAITDQARACAEEIRAMLFDPINIDGIGIVGAYLLGSERNSQKNELLGRALALLEIMAGEK